MKPDCLPDPPGNVLIIKPSALGDIVHTLPILNLLRKCWPKARISWLVSRVFANLIEGHPQLDQVITFERKRFAQSWYNPTAAIKLFGFARRLRREKFDLVIDLQGLLRSGGLSWLTHAPCRVGFANAREFAPHFYTHRIPVDNPEQHAIDRYLMITDALGCGREPVEFPFVVTDDDRSAVEGMLNGENRFAVMLPGAMWDTKRWPTERFAELVNPLRDRFGLTTVLAGSKGEIDLAAKIPAKLNLIGQTTLRQLVDLIRRSSLVIANDSGPMHIAAALGRPLVTMFGPTNPVRTGPYQRMESVVQVDVPCSPCYSRKCSHISCMKWMKVEQVLSTAAAQLQTA